MTVPPQYSRNEEIANSLTHGIGFVLGFFGLFMLLKRPLMNRDEWHVLSFIIYGLSLMALYLSSTLYHGIPHPRAKRILKVMDHSSIFLLIAGTYTPVVLAYQRDFYGWVTLGTVWGFALVGIILKIFFAGQFRLVSTFIYLGMGWIPLLLAQSTLKIISSNGAGYWILAGGLSYSLGTIFYLQKKVPFTHAIWHLFVLGGSILHYYAIWNYI